MNMFIAHGRWCDRSSIDAYVIQRPPAIASSARAAIHQVPTRAIKMGQMSLPLSWSPI